MLSRMTEIIAKIFIMALKYIIYQHKRTACVWAAHKRNRWWGGSNLWKCLKFI